MTRLRLAALERSGWLRRRSPLREWQDYALAEIVRAGVTHQPDELVAWREGKVAPVVASLPRVDRNSIQEADEILHGEFRYFSGERFTLSFPPDWRLNPWTGQRSASNEHWSQTSWDATGDIKWVWELSRFAWAYALMRAYAATHDEKYPTAFWTLFEDWCRSNPPNACIQWKCGQEVALRLITVSLAADVFRGSSSSTPGRRAFLSGFAAAHAERIESHIDYALSQKNNHGLSEAAGLFTAGTLFPELRQAEKWRNVGRGLLERQVREQIYDDGSYIQHSFNYQRLALSLLIWCIHLDHGRQFTNAFRERVQRSALMLLSCMDDTSGEAPNSGGNDGTNLFPLSACPYSDLRPIVQLALSKLGVGKPFAAGPWDELHQWFAPEMTGSRYLEAEGASIPATGCASILNGDSWGMLRCIDYKNRPAHADGLHVDIFHRGLPVLLDAGTFSYNEPGWENELARTCVHNTITVDHRDQMTRVSKFLWVDWGRVRVLRREPGLIEAEHHSHAGIVHRRTLAAAGDGRWLFTDEVLGPGEHDLELHWLLRDGHATVDGATVTVRGERGCALAIGCSSEMSLRLVRAGARVGGTGSHRCDALRGWYASTYRVKAPALSLVAHCRAHLPVRFTSMLTLGALAGDDDGAYAHASESLLTLPGGRQ